MRNKQLLPLNPIAVENSTVQASIRGRKSTKRPSCKIQRNSKFQTPIAGIFTWCLGVGDSLVLGCWGLELSLNRLRLLKAAVLPIGCLLAHSVNANPAGGTVTQGSASISSSGSHLTVKQNSGFAQINWQSFNISVGETTTFVQPSSTSWIWNQINSGNPSQILGSIHANGLVVLQNQSGFYIGGEASIEAHGIILTTAHAAPADISSGGPWNFNAPPPTAKIINYGSLDIGGGPAFLIASDIENHGTISDPGGKVGLYAGKQVLISSSPDGRGLSAEVTLPQGSVDNSGRLIVDGGSIAMRAQVVNQGGLVQANSVRNVNGVIELYASDSLNLGANSVISAQGDSKGVSAGGSVTVKSDNNFSDQKGSVINIAGGAHGGNGGHVDISASQMSSINSTIDGHAAKGYTAGQLLIDPDNILLTDYGNSAPNNGTVNGTDPNSSGSSDTLTLDVNTFNDLINNNQLSSISLAAKNNIEVGTLWYVPDSSVADSQISLSAGHNITIDDASGISAGQNWSIKMTAGTELASASGRTSGNDGIYLWGSGIIQTRNGKIDLTAANEVMVDDGQTSGLNPYGNGITTTRGGSINVTATYGDVNTGGDPLGYDITKILKSAPYYSLSRFGLGGISTANGGNVTITAGGNVTSYLPTGSDNSEAGSGAFGAAPGDVTITAGGSIYGHYMVRNGTGTITSENGNVGAPLTSQGFALSLTSGKWIVNALKGSIYLQEVRNPNGVFNNNGNPSSNPGYHLFDYSDDAAVTLDAADTVEITGLGIPRKGDSVPLIFPPSLTVKAGAGGFVLDTSVILFSSPLGDLNITTTDGGNMVGVKADPSIADYPTLSMSDSGGKQWLDASSFGPADHAAIPVELDNLNPVEISISGSIDTLNLVTSKETQITVDGDINNSSFIGRNLRSSDTTFIHVGGKIFDQPYYNFSDPLSQPIKPVTPLNPAVPPNTTWDSIFSLLVDPKQINSTTVSASMDPATLKSIAAQMGFSVFQSSSGSANPGFIYDPTTKRLGFAGPMKSGVLSALTGPLEQIVYDQNGVPEVANGHFVTAPVTFVPASVISSLYNESQLIPQTAPQGFMIGGPGLFDIKAASIQLGTSPGIESWGFGGTSGKVNYNSLLPYTPSGAAIQVTTTSGDISMQSSRIASFDGGDVIVNSQGGIDLGTQGVSVTSDVAYGIYTSGHSDVVVTAQKDINIEGSRIAAYNGGNITVESYTGNVNIGSGGNGTVNVPLVETRFGAKDHYTQQDSIYGSGIVANSLPSFYQTSGGSQVPGNITVTTLQGSITADQAGILQLALDGTLSGGPTIDLTAGSDGYIGNIDLGDSGMGIIGMNATLKATGYIKGLAFVSGNANLNAATGITGNVVAGGNIGLNGGSGTISGNFAGMGGISVTGSGPVVGQLLSQNVSVGNGPAVSTFGRTATATAASQSAAQQASTQTKQDVTGTDSLASNDDSKQKKKGPVLQRIKRVTVILPKT